MNYEKNKEALENLLEKFDSTETLKESLELYEKGIKLAAQCMKELNDLKGKFEALNADFETMNPVETDEDYEEESED
mgnify:CR=1 FL=1